MDFLAAGSGLGLAKSAVWNEQFRRDIARLVKRMNPSIIHVHTPFPLASPSVFYANGATPLVATNHSFRYSCAVGTFRRDGLECRECEGRRLKAPALIHGCYKGSRLRTGPVAVSLSLHRAIGTWHRPDVMIAISEFSRRSLIAEGFQASRVVVKPNFIADTAIRVRHSGSSARHYLFSGRLVEEKGVRTLLEAWSQYPGSSTLAIAGRGPLEGLCRAAADRDPRITFLGWLDRSSLRAQLAGATALVFPSEWYEAGTAMSIIDALAVGLPVIASDLENVSRDIVESGSGWTFQVRSSISLVHTVAMVDQMTLGSWQQTSVAARAFYERNHSPWVARDRLLSAYANAQAIRATGSVAVGDPG